jgi:hypothetical protein
MKANAKTMPGRGLAGWLLGRLRAARRPQPRLALVERIALAPRQSLALVEAEGKRFLVATSAEGAPAFYPLDRETGRGNPGSSRGRIVPFPHPVARPAADRFARISW